MFKIVREFQKTKNLRYSGWFDTNMAEKKPSLKRSTLNLAIDNYKSRTEGGAALSKKTLSKEIDFSIRKEWEEKYGRRYRRRKAPEATLRKYISRISGQRTFNINDNVSNKTESRRAAEFSIRSTISYAMAVLCSHYINAKPSKYHLPQPVMDNDPIYSLVKEINKEMLGITGITDIEHFVTHVLPHLITSTDECTIFVSSEIINNKEVWYFSCRPTKSSKPFQDSGKRDVYTTDMAGDKHHRGIRITLNNTFTAGGTCAPVFACVYGLSATEMPKDDIVVKKVKGLVAASVSTANMSEGYVVFVRGKYETLEQIQEKEKEQERERTEPVTGIPIPKRLSKEARVAKLYKELVYYPLVRHIRTAYYGMSETTEAIPENLRAVTWMDGCHGQLHLTTQEDIMELEEFLKITACKQSAARTAVEQAADVGAMFKIIRYMIKQMPAGTKTNSPIYSRLQDMFEELENISDSEKTDIVILPLHKKKAILAGLSKLPTAMGSAFTPEIITQAFKDNGQINEDESAIPNIDGLMGTYRGNIPDDHILKDYKSIIETYYREMFLNGRVEESTFETNNIESDKDSQGNDVTRDFEISKENCQRAKILSASKQRQARLDLIDSIKVAQDKKHTELYDKETDKYTINSFCCKRILDTYIHTRTATSNDGWTSDKSFEDMLPFYTRLHFGEHDFKKISKPTM